MRAERRLGEMIKGAPKNGGTRGQLTGDVPVGGSVSAPPTDATPTLAEVGLTKKQSSKARKIADMLYNRRYDLFRDSYYAVLVMK